MILHSAKRLIHGILGFFGLQITRKMPVSECQTSLSYYPVMPDCQVAGLGFLLSFFLGDHSRGIYVEVGAFDGISFSNTYGLAVRGWSGLMIEAIPEYAVRCSQVHRDHPGINVVNIAIGETDGGILDVQLAGPLSTGNTTTFNDYNKAEWAQREISQSTIKVPIIRLDTLLQEKRVPVGFDLLVVDVEGYEEHVFAGFDLKRWHPKMMIWELADTHPDLPNSRVTDYFLQRRILSGGYGVVYKDGINTVFVRKDILDATYIIADTHKR